MTLLWMSYAFLSLVVLLSGYLGLAFLPRLPRLVITWTVAGVIAVPTRFQMPLVEGETHTGLAPAVLVAALAFLERNAAVMVPALLLVAASASAGALLGLVLWWHGREAAVDEDEEGYPSPPSPQTTVRPGERREPRLG